MLQVYVTCPIRWSKTCFLEIHIAWVIIWCDQSFKNIFRGTLENILLAMLFHVRELGLRRILKATKTDWKGKISEFNLSNLNFEADEYFQMINWDSPLEPPNTMSPSDEDIASMIRNGSQFEIE